MTLTADVIQVLMLERGDRHRHSVGVVALAAVANREQSDPAGQLGRSIDDRLAGRCQTLGE